MYRIARWPHGGTEHCVPPTWLLCVFRWTSGPPAVYTKQGYFTNILVFYILLFLLYLQVHQSSSSASTSRGSTITQTEETVRIHMHLLEDGEQYVYEDEEGEINFETLSLGSKQYVGNGSLVVAAKKPLKLPSCQRTEGFLTLFDDHELRANVIIGQQWQRRWNIGSGSSGGTTSWRRLWFRVEVINNTEQEVSITNDDLSLKQQDPNDNNTCQNTIILRYWMYPEHVEQERMVNPIIYHNLSLMLNY